MDVFVVVVVVGPTFPGLLLGWDACDPCAAVVDGVETDVLVVEVVVVVIGAAFAEAVFPDDG